jgi:hypothetical protein
MPYLESPVVGAKFFHYVAQRVAELNHALHFTLLISVADPDPVPF